MSAWRGPPNQDHPALKHRAPEHLGIEGGGPQVDGGDVLADRRPNGLVAEIVVKHAAGAVLRTERSEGPIQSFGGEEIQAGPHQPVAVPGEVREYLRRLAP